MPGRGGLIAYEENTGLVLDEVVADPGDVARRGKVHVHEVFQDLGGILLGVPGGCLPMLPALKGRRDHEQMVCNRAPIRIGLAGGMSALGWQGCALPDAAPESPRSRRRPGGRGPGLFP